MELVVSPGGTVRCIYGEAVDLSRLGAVNITRASYVEPTTGGHWLADLSAVNGPVLGPFPIRSDALAAESAWLNRHWLLPSL